MEVGEELTLGDGSVYRLLRRAESPDETMELEVELPPRVMAPPKHVHRFHAERFEVVSGELQLFSGGRWRTLPAGEAIDVPAGELHSFRNRSRERTVMRAQATPGGYFQAWFDDYCSLVRTGRVTSPRRLRSAMELARLTRRHPQAMTYSRALEAGISMLARLRGRAKEAAGGSAGRGDAG